MKYYQDYYDAIKDEAIELGIPGPMICQQATADMLNDLAERSEVLAKKVEALEEAHAPLKREAPTLEQFIDKTAGRACIRCGMREKDLRRKGHYTKCKVYGVVYGNHKYTNPK